MKRVVREERNIRVVWKTVVERRCDHLSKMKILVSKECVELHLDIVRSRHTEVRDLSKKFLQELKLLVATGFTLEGKWIWKQIKIWCTMYSLYRREVMVHTKSDNRRQGWPQSVFPPWLSPGCLLCTATDLGQVQPSLCRKTKHMQNCCYGNIHTNLLGLLLFTRRTEKLNWIQINITME